MTFAKESYILISITSGFYLKLFYGFVLPTTFSKCYKYCSYALFFANITNALYLEIFCEENIAIQNLFSLYQMPEFTNPGQIATRCVVPSGSTTSKAPTFEVGLSPLVIRMSHLNNYVFFCTFIVLFELWGPRGMCSKCLEGISEI